MPSRHAGFTLLEVLVALVLLSLFAVSSYRALDAVLAAERHARAEMAAWQRLATAYARIEADLADAVPAPVPPVAGRPGFRAERGETGFSLDRQLPEDEAAGLARVAYRFAGGRLERAALAPEAEPAPLMDGLSGAEFRYLDEAGVWQAEWAAIQSGQLPRAVALVLAWPDGRRLRRVFLLR